jgi:hypothetical protein
MDYGTCASQSSHKIITAEENGRKLTIKNPTARLIRKVKVDGCLEDIAGKRCDYLFEIDDPAALVIYLELKGCDIEKAYAQLVATLALFQPIHKNCKKACHIVASRIPKAAPKTQQLNIRLQKAKQATLHISTQQAVIDV